jgi:CBS domain-containing protein
MGIEELMSRRPATCGPDDSLRDAEQKMQGANCESLPVTAGEGSRLLVGVITDGDIRMAAELEGRSLEELRVRDAMAKEVRVCTPADGLAEAEEFMHEEGLRRLPVVDEAGRLLGVLRLADVARTAMRNSEALSAQISAAHFSVAASHIHEPRRSVKPR